MPESFSLVYVFGGGVELVLHGPPPHRLALVLHRQFNFTDGLGGQTSLIFGYSIFSGFRERGSGFKYLEYQISNVEFSENIG